MDTKEKLLPGTAATYVVHGEKGFTKIDMLLEATGGLTLSQVCAVTGLEGSTIQNWVKRGWVAHPKGKKYEEEHIARILIINALKECIRLEQIAQLMVYINGEAGSGDVIIKESQLFNYLCDALQRLDQAEDLSRVGVEVIAEIVLKDYTSGVPKARAKIRRALGVMIYACVCTDVKRRTEAMMERVLIEMENPDLIEDESEIEPYIASVAAATVTQAPEEPPESAEPVVEVKKTEETKKTVAQALREWDLNNAPTKQDIIEPADEAPPAPVQNETKPSAEKSTQRPWYFRRN